MSGDSIRSSSRSMGNTSIEKFVGTALIASEDAIAMRLLVEALEELALSVEVCTKVLAASDRVKRRKLEVVVIDFALGDQATFFLGQVRGSLSNRTAVIFAITNSSEETARALKSGAGFALERPLTIESIRHTLKAAYRLIVRERRRYFRYQISVPAAISNKGAHVIFGKTVNVSERGMAVSTSTPLMPGTEVTAQFTLPVPNVSIKAECRVCWTNDKGETGLSFLFLPSDLGSQLQAWLSQQLNEQLGMPQTSDAPTQSG